MRIPGQVPLQPVFDMRRCFETVKFAGINHQLSFAPQAFHRLIHLLAANDGNIPIDFSAHEQRWRRDLVDFVEE